LWVVASIVAVGCGKSTSGSLGTGAGATGGSDAAGLGNASGNAGMGVPGTGGANALGGNTDGGGKPSAGGATGSGDGGTTLAAAGTGGATETLCPGHHGFITVQGELPEFGTDLTLRSGCAKARVSYPEPASYDGGPGEATAGTITVIGCNADGSREISAKFAFTQHRPDAGGTPGLDSAGLSYGVDGGFRSLPITSLTETKTPTTDWLAISLGSDDGVGEVYEGSFVAEGTVGSTSAKVEVSFSVCHVANLD
jgi:hypothetical protein